MHARGNYVKFLVYLVAVVLLNVAGLTLFFRADLTGNRVFSLSSVSRQVVASLSEPLTVKVFFSPNLPAPHNGTERYLLDLLSEYAQAGNRFFNYQVFDLSEDETEQGRSNRELAESYGIFPVQIQNIEQDEVKFQKAYMGMVLIHGDVVEKMATILSTDGLEYRVTSAVRKMNNKISALLNLKDPVQVALYMSSSLNAVGSYMNLPDVGEVPRQVRTIVEGLNAENYDKLQFVHFDPSRSAEADAAARRLGLLQLSWKAFTDEQGRAVDGGEAVAGLVIRHGKRMEQLPLIQVMRLPIFGTTYQLAGPEELQEAIGGAVNTVIDVNAAVGYLADHGCRPLTGRGMPGAPVQPLNIFNSLLTRDYAVKPVQLKQGGIPEGIECLIIAGPTEPFSDFALYQIDQFLMRGKSLAIYLDAFKETMPGGQNAMMMGQGPTYAPLDTGLEKLLASYGLTLDPVYLLDEKCYEQRLPQEYGGGIRKLYFAPLIQHQQIDQELDFMKPIKGLVMLKASPLSAVSERIGAQGLTARALLSSSDKAWEMGAPINLNPMFMTPPPENEPRESRPLAYLLEGAFDSYFSGRPVPEKPAEEEKPPAADGSTDSQTGDTAARPADAKAGAAVAAGTFTSQGASIDRGQPGRILVAGTSEILTDNILDEEGRSPNAQFVLNSIDYLNGQQAYALMRSKGQPYNPLAPVDAATRTFIKAFNIAGLPVLVVLAGLLIWMRRSARKRAIMQLYATME